jgi:hypothetical protein
MCRRLDEKASSKGLLLKDLTPAVKPAAAASAAGDRATVSAVPAESKRTDSRLCAAAGAGDSRDHFRFCWSRLRAQAPLLCCQMLALAQLSLARDIDGAHGAGHGAKLWRSLGDLLLSSSLVEPYVQDVKIKRAF